MTMKPLALPTSYAGIHRGIVSLLDTARQTAARSVNALMTASYWEIGRRIIEAEQKGSRRAGYGEQLMERLSSDLTARFGRGFSPDNLENMRRFFLAYPLSSISETVSRKFELSELAQVFTLPWKAAMLARGALLPDAELLRKELESTRRLLESRCRLPRARA